MRKIIINLDAAPDLQIKTEGVITELDFINAIPLLLKEINQEKSLLIVNGLLELSIGLNEFRIENFKNSNDNKDL